MCSPAEEWDHAQLVHAQLVQARRTSDFVLGQYLRLPIEKALDLSSPAGFDQAVAELASDLRQSTQAFDAAACIGCGACVAACKNASAMLFVAAKVSHLGLLPQGEVERTRRVQRMVAQMDDEGFGNCTNTYDCEAACPKEIGVGFIARMNRDFLSATIKEPIPT